MNSPTKRMLTAVILMTLMTVALSGSERIPGDIDADGDVDFADFLLLAQNFGRSGPPPSADSPDTVTIVVRDTITLAGTNRPEVKASWADVVKVVEPTVYWVGVTFEPTPSVLSPPLTFAGTAFGIGIDAIATNAHVGIGIVARMEVFRASGLSPVPVVV